MKRSTRVFGLGAASWAAAIALVFGSAEAHALVQTYASGNVGFRIIRTDGGSATSDHFNPFLEDSITPSILDSTASIGDALEVNGYTAQFQASANHQTGHLRVEARASTSSTTSPDTAMVGVPFLGVPVTGGAAIRDELTFSSSSGLPYTVSVTMDYSGQFFHDSSAPALGEAGGELSLNQIVGPDDQQVFTIPLLAGPAVGGPISGSVTAQLTLTGTRTVQLNATLGGGIYRVEGGGHDVFFDYGNSATLSISVPENVSWSSASGLLLTATPVPLPPAAVLLGPGVALLTLFRRRR